MLTEGVDFLLADTDPYWIGRKSLAVNLSDLAAMSAVPCAVVIAVAIPQYPVRCSLGNLKSSELLDRLFQGIEPLAKQYKLDIAGGDTNTWDGGLVISITAIGKTTSHGVFRRDGAKVGDRIFVTGPLGGSILEHQFTFEPRINEALFLNENYEIRSAMDISDGLSLDLSRLIEASGCGAVLYENKIPISTDAFRLAELEAASTMTPLHGKMVSAFEHALIDGEDFELLFTVSQTIADRLLNEQPLRNGFSVELHEIGEITQSGGMELLQTNGLLHPLVAMGYEHGAGEASIVE